MPRTVNEQEHARKRGDILDAAMKLIFAKGYERMTIQSILADLRVSSGAFYHYFDSKPALLEAFIERIRLESEKALLPIVDDPHLSAIDKLQGFFAALDRERLDRRADVVELARVWYTDHNAIVREKVAQAVVKQRAPMLTRIVQQGVREGVFATPHPDQAGEIVLALVQGMADTHSRLLLSLDGERDEARRVAGIVAAHIAYMDAIERVLGAPPGSLHRADAETARMWVTALGGIDNATGDVTNRIERAGTVATSSN